MKLGILFNLGVSLWRHSAEAAGCACFTFLWPQHYLVTAESCHPQPQWWVGLIPLLALCTPSCSALLSDFPLPVNSTPFSTPVLKALNIWALPKPCGLSSGPSLPALLPLHQAPCALPDCLPLLQEASTLVWECAGVTPFPEEGSENIEGQIIMLQASWAQVSAIPARLCLCESSHGAHVSGGHGCVLMKLHLQNSPRG